MPSGPKSNKFMNRHAAEAREREDERKSREKTAAAKARDDAMWADDDPKASKRLDRQREAEAKAEAKAQSLAERREQLEAEDAALRAKVPVKVSRRQIQKDLSKMIRDYDKAKPPAEVFLPEGNPNRRVGAASEGGGEIRASGGVSEALAAVRAGVRGGPLEPPEDRHLGRRARVLYRQFCAARLAELKEERPGLRRTQYNDLLWEAWQRCAENPFVQRSEQRSRERLEQERRWMEADDDDNDEEEEETNEGKEKGK